MGPQRQAQLRVQVQAPLWPREAAAGHWSPPTLRPVRHTRHAVPPVTCTPLPASLCPTQRRRRWGQRPAPHDPSWGAVKGRRRRGMQRGPPLPVGPVMAAAAAAVAVAAVAAPHPHCRVGFECHQHQVSDPLPVPGRVALDPWAHHPCPRPSRCSNTALVVVTAVGKLWWGLHRWAPSSPRLLPKVWTRRIPVTCHLCHNLPRRCHLLPPSPGSRTGLQLCAPPTP